MQRYKKVKKKHSKHHEKDKGKKRPIKRFIYIKFTSLCGRTNLLTKINNL